MGGCSSVAREGRPVTEGLAVQILAPSGRGSTCMCNTSRLLVYECVRHHEGVEKVLYKCNQFSI